MTDLSTSDIPVSDLTFEGHPSGRSHRFLSSPSFVPTYVGIGVVAIGFVLIAVAWAKVAGLADVASQLPYLVSAGITGLALVMVGLVVINVAAKRQDGDELARQVERLAGVVEDLQRALREREGGA